MAKNKIKITFNPVENIILDEEQIGVLVFHSIFGWSFMPQNPRTSFGAVSMSAVTKRIKQLNKQHGFVLDPESPLTIWREEWIRM